MNLQLHATGASFVATKVSKNPRDLIIDLVKENPTASRDARFTEFRALIQADDEYQRAVDWYFFVNMHDYLTTNRNNHLSRRATAHDASSVEEIKRKIVNVVLLDLQLPNGKLLRDATFSDCAKAGGWYAKLAKKGKPSQVVGKVLTEQQLQAIK